MGATLLWRTVTYPSGQQVQEGRCSACEWELVAVGPREVERAVRLHNAHVLDDHPRRKEEVPSDE